jgi:hypothetical protein
VEQWKVGLPLDFGRVVRMHVTTGDHDAVLVLMAGEVLDVMETEESAEELEEGSESWSSYRLYV